MKNMELKEQMELTLGTRASHAARRGKKPSRRAGWWFSQMRQAVDRAMDWSPRPTPPAHQVHFSLERHSPNW